MYYILIITTVTAWGVGSFLGKIATDYNNPTFITVCSNVLYFVFSIPLMLFLLRSDGAVGKFDFSLNALWPIVAIGMLGLLGEWVYFNALAKGPGAPVIALTALYPVVSMLLLISLLGERFSRNQGIGLIFIFVGLVIFLWSREETTNQDHVTELNISLPVQTESDASQKTK